VATLAPGDVADIYALRRLLEAAGATALLAGNLAGMEPLAEAVRDMAVAADRCDRRRVVEADVAFHLSIVAALANRRLQDAMRGAMMELRLALSVTDRAYGDLAEEVRQHQVLLDRFREGTPGAAQALEEHLRRSEAMVYAALKAPGSGGAELR
jgi:DNA-binding GntR family transcriptional regulator